MRDLSHVCVSASGSRQHARVGNRISKCLYRGTRTSYDHLDRSGQRPKRAETPAPVRSARAEPGPPGARRIRRSGGPVFTRAVLGLARAGSDAIGAATACATVPRRPHGPARCAQPSGSCETRRARSEKRDVTFRYDSPQSTARGDATSDRRPGRRSRTRRLAREPERVSVRRRRLRLHISTRDVHSRLLDVSVGPGAESPYSRVTSSLGQSSRLTRSSRSPRTRRTPRRQGHLP